MPDRQNPDAAYLRQAATERMAEQKACGELLALLRKYHPKHETQKHRLDAARKSA